MSAIDLDGPYVTWDPRLGLTFIKGPGGFTQLRQEEWQAEAFARLLGFPFERSVPGGTLPVSAVGSA